MKGKVIAVISSLAMAIPVAAYASSTESVNVQINVHAAAPSYFALNFDTIIFDGGVGGTALGTALSSGEIINQAKYDVSTILNFDIFVSGTDPTSPNGTALSSQRIAVQQFSNSGGHEGEVRIQSIPTKLYGGSEQHQTHNLHFDLDLTYKNNGFTDNDMLMRMQEDTQFTSQVTFTYTGL